MTRTRPIPKKKKIKVIDEPEEEQFEYSLRYLRKILKPKRKAFCAEYVRNGWNGTKAYMKAYNTTNKKVAGAESHKFLKKPEIQQYIAFIKDDFEKLCGISKARQIKEYEKIAYSSIADMHLKWIERKDFEKLTPDQKAAIESIETKIIQKVIDKELCNIEYVKIKLHSKTAALQRIDKLLDYESADKVDIKGNTTLSLGTGTVESIRKAFGLDELKKPE